MDIKLFWEDVLAQRENKLNKYFHDEAIIKWPCTNEQFTVTEFIKANCAYPGHWIGEIEKIIYVENTIISIVKVLASDKSSSHFVVNFLTLKDDKIIEMVEYWAENGVAPDWRVEMNIGQPIY